MSSPSLHATTPQSWMDTHLARHMRAHDTGVDEADREWLSFGDLFANHGSHLRASHQCIVDRDGATPAAAAKWLVGWYPGRLAHAAGYLYAFAAAAVVIDPQQVRFGRHPDGWTQLIDFGHSQMVVTTGHPWAGQPGVRVVNDERTLVQIGLNSLVTISRPVLETVRGYAKVGLATLWSEVIDEFALAGRTEGELPADTAVVARVNAATRITAMPWRKHPHLWAANAAGRNVIVGQKGGCCLAYQSTGPAEADESEDTRAWLQCFPPDVRGRHYCNTCSLLPAQECQARQLYETPD